MLLKEVLTRIQALYSHGVQSDDSRLRNRHIYSKVLTVRANLIAQKLRKRQSISQWSYQTIDCVKLMLAPISECSTITKGYTVLRSKIKIPNPLMKIDEPALQVTSILGNLNFSFVEWYAVKYAKGAKYTASKPNWYIKDGYLYLTSDKLLEQITLIGLFENPAEADDFNNQQSCEIIQDCISPLDKEFKIDMDMLEPLIEIAAKELVEEFLQVPEDRFNDAADNNSKIQK